MSHSYLFITFHAPFPSLLTHPFPRYSHTLLITPTISSHFVPSGVHNDLSFSSTHDDQKIDPKMDPKIDEVSLDSVLYNSRRAEADVALARRYQFPHYQHPCAIIPCTITPNTITPCCFIYVPNVGKLCICNANVVLNGYCEVNLIVEEFNKYNVTLS